MAELLTHVFVAYSLATVLSFRYAWITPKMVTIAMMGALIPDLSRISLLIDEAVITEALGIPISWFGFHTLGGSLVAILVGVALAQHDHRRHVFLLLALGACSHLLLDLFLYKPSGVSAPLLWPVFAEGLAIPGFYLSSDRWPAVTTGLLAVIIWYRRYHTTLGYDEDE